MLKNLCCLGLRALVITVAECAVLWEANWLSLSATWVWYSLCPASACEICLLWFLITDVFTSFVGSLIFVIWYGQRRNSIQRIYSFCCFCFVILELIVNCVKVLSSSNRRRGVLETGFWWAVGQSEPPLRSSCVDPPRSSSFKSTVQQAESRSLSLRESESEGCDGTRLGWGMGGGAKGR